ncbi:amidoligase family protein [Celerinatantimonas sp. YJH-8]|uniref:amidoligase family protein n=1 Tax=Celerinatantimonas sp. YJH-8 TaxID=3228714 RepID=UPI0038CA1DB7
MMHEVFIQPIQPYSSNHQLRHIGYELEFAGIDLKTTGRIIAHALDGQWQVLSEAEGRVTTDTGTFKVEIDWQFAKTTARQRIAQRTLEQGTTKAEDPLMEWMTKLATVVVPVEVICPPLTVEQLQLLHPMITQLRENGALGTGSSLRYAFGVHINPELPSYDSATIIAYLQSFIICQQWLVEHHQVDLMRRVTPYINFYPERYNKLVMNYQGNESLPHIIHDYLKYNATRNRALDLLPLFMFLEPEQVSIQLDDPLIHARPTLHYRLPNCEIERPEWDLAQSWNTWCVVEQIANTPSLRNTLIEQWLNDNHLINRYSEHIWQQLDTIHRDLLSA